MCTKSQNPGKITKIRALSGRLSPNTRISGRARIYPGDLGTLSLTKYCNLNVVCPPESPYLCQTPGSLSRSAPSSNSRLSPTLLHPLPPHSLSTDMSCNNLSLLITSSSSSSLSPFSSTLAPKTSQSFLPDPNHLLLTLLPWCIPVLDHIAAKGLGSQSDSTPATAFRSSCPPSYEYNTDLMRRWTDNLMTR